MLHVIKMNLIRIRSTAYKTTPFCNLYHVTYDVAARLTMVEESKLTGQAGETGWPKSNKIQL